MEETRWDVLRERYRRVSDLITMKHAPAVLMHPHSYTYEVCLFGTAKQKPNKGGSTFTLG